MFPERIMCNYLYTSVLITFTAAISSETTIKPTGIGTTTIDDGLNAAVCFSDINKNLLMFTFILVLTQW